MSEERRGEILGTTPLNDDEKKRKLKGFRNITANAIKTFVERDRGEIRTTERGNIMERIRSRMDISRTYMNGLPITTRTDIRQTPARSSVEFDTFFSNYKTISIGSTIQASLPKLVPLAGGTTPEVSSESLLKALKEETKIQNTEVLYKDCCEAANFLKESHALDKFVLNEGEAAVLCALSKLLISGFPVKAMIESCKEKAPSTFLVSMLVALRKLPRYRGVMYFEHESQTNPTKREKGNTFQPSFCVTSKSMNIKKEGTRTGRYREIFRIEDGWGYDISEFSLTKDANGYYGKLTNI